MITLRILHFWLIIVCCAVSILACGTYAFSLKRKVSGFNKEIRKLRYDIGLKSVDLYQQIEKLEVENESLRQQLEDKNDIKDVKPNHKKTNVKGKVKDL